MNIEQNIKEIQAQITELKPNNEVNLIAVSKNFPVTAIEKAYQAGQRRFGENYVQEFAAKAEKLHHLDIEWHFIGSIQSNKTKIIAKFAHWVHTLTKYTHAKRLNDQRPLECQPLKVLIEVNISNEDSKHGLDNFAQIHELAIQIQQLPNLKLVGLMGMAANGDDTNLIQQQFLQLSNYLDQLNQHGFELTQLSMGMSQDYPLAIKAGANLIRIGSKIFGERNYDNN